MTASTSWARWLLVCAAALLAAAAHADVGVTQLQGMVGDGPVTVFYPSSSVATNVNRGLHTLQLAADGAPARGNGRLVVISHGSGGSPWEFADLSRALVAAGFVVALPEHKGDNYRDQTQVGPASWKQRPHEVSRAIDAVGQDARFAPLLVLGRVGMYGMSAGGHTALTLAGGRWSPARLRTHCEANIAQDFQTCVGLNAQLTGGPLDGVKQSVALRLIRSRMDDDAWYAHTDARIRAVVAGVPFAADFDLTSLAQPPVALGLVNAGQDKWLVPRFHGQAVLAACATCELVADLPTAGHGALLSPLPPLDRMGSSLLRELLADPPGFDRSTLPAVDQAIAAFFTRHLLP